MEIFGVGPLEFILVLVLALIILGPEDMVGTARKIGQWVYRVVRSPTWRSIMATSQDLRELPKKIVREAGLEDTMNEIKQTADEVKTDLKDTTREINTEMQAATTQVNREMQTAAQNVDAGMKAASAETQAAMQSAAAGLSGSENTIAPPQVEVKAAELAETIPVPEERPITPYEVQLTAFATGLGGKEIESTQPEEDTIFHVTPAENVVPTTLSKEVQAETPPKLPYVGRLELFAQSLGATTLQEKEGSALEGLAPAEPVPAPWAVGIPVGLDLNSAGGMEERLKDRMEAMQKSIEKLEAKTKAASGEEEPPAEPKAEESAPTSVPADLHGNGTEPAIPPARARRNAKRPQEAKTTPAAEGAEGETPKAAPRKRAAKTTPPADQTAEEETPKPTRKRTAKAAPSAEQVAEGEAPKPAPRKRAVKKTPLKETTDQDSTSTQA